MPCGHAHARVCVHALLYQIRQIARAVSYPDNLHPVRDDAVEDQIAADGHIPKLRGQIGAGGAKLGECRERVTNTVDAMEQGIGGVLVVGGDGEPDFDKIIFGACGANETSQELTHGRADGAGAAASWRRASCLIASMLPNRPGPLARPSAHTRRRSSCS